CDTDPVAFWLSVTVSVTGYVPPAPYVCDGFCTVAVLPSPNAQLYPAIEPSGSLLVLVKPHARLLQLDENAATGGLFVGGGGGGGGGGAAVISNGSLVASASCPAVAIRV